MREKAVAKTDAFMGAFDQSRDIGEHELAPIDVDHTELRMQRGEWIVGNLGLGCAHRGEKSGFAGVWKADNPGIGDELEPQPNRELDAGLAGIGVTRRAIGRAFEMGIAESAIAAARQHNALFDFGQVGQQRDVILVVDLRADRHFENDIGAVGAVPVLAHAGAAVGRGEMLLVAVIDQRIKPIDRFGDDIAALAAIAAVRTAEFDEFLAPERDATVAAVAGANVNLGLVEKLHLLNSVKARNGTTVIPVPRWPIMPA